MNDQPNAGILWPQSASSGAADIDAVYFALIGISLFFIILIGGLALGYGVKYRAGAVPARGSPISRPTILELTWIIGAFLLTLSVFAWGAAVFVDVSSPPPNAQTIYVVGKQWMWKVRHPGGRREINELHVPAGTPIRLVLATQDVIHSFFLPAFRIKQDAVPNMYTSMWFQADKPGIHHLFCAEYCGAQHANMRGRIVVLEQQAFQAWLTQSEGPAESTSEGFSQNLTASAAPLIRFGCTDCHRDHEPTAPDLAGAFGQRVALHDGSRALVDEDYLRRAILNPDGEISAGYASPSAMPSFKGQIGEDELIDLIEAIKSLPAPSSEMPP